MRQILNAYAQKIEHFQTFCNDSVCFFYLVARTGLAGLTAISVSESVLADPEGTWVLAQKTEHLAANWSIFEVNNIKSDADIGRQKLTTKKFKGKKYLFLLR